MQSAPGAGKDGGVVVVTVDFQIEAVLVDVGPEKLLVAVRPEGAVLERVGHRVWPGKRFRRHRQQQQQQCEQRHPQRTRSVYHRQPP